MQSTVVVVCLDCPSEYETVLPAERVWHMEMEFKPLWGSNFNRAFRKLGVPQECFSQQSHLMTHISTLILRVKTCPWPQKWPLGDKKICMVALFVCQLTNLALCIIPYILNNLPLYFLQVPEWIIWERKKKRLILFCKAGSGMCHLSDGTIFTFILTILRKITDWSQSISAYFKQHCVVGF